MGEKRRKGEKRGKKGEKKRPDPKKL